jgi:hypothetical protein
MADSGREDLYGVNNSVCSGESNFINTGRVELNPGSTDNIVQVACSGCNRTLKLGTQCDKCGRWFHDSCGNVKVQVEESGIWNCVRCINERL